jgi:exopolysaccharide production protein ExoZ
MRLNNLQILRAIAASLVVYYHCDVHFLGLDVFGSCGVDIFFVLSGFIMTMIAGRGSGAPTPAEFLQRRIARIVPLYWSMTLAIFTVAALAPSVLHSTRSSLGELAKSLFFVPFFKDDWSIQPLLYVGWTLNLEMYFYACIALGLWLWRDRWQWVASGLITAILAGCTMFGSRGNALVESYRRPLVFEFLAGIVAFHVYCAVSPRAAGRWKFALGMLTAAALVALPALEAIGGGGRGDVWRAGTWGPCAFVCVTGAALLSKAGLDLSWRPLVLAGDASYALYLSHPYVHGVQNLASEKLPWLRLNHAGGCAAAVAASIAAAVVLHLTVERPLNQFASRHLLSRRRAPEDAGVVTPGL